MNPATQRILLATLVAMIAYKPTGSTFVPSPSQNRKGIFHVDPRSVSSELYSEKLGEDKEKLG